MASSSLTAPTFNGSSSYSSDFQQVLTRAVQLASLPMQQMQNNVNDLTNQQQSLAGLEATFVSLQGALQSVSAATQGSLGATVSDNSVVSANASSTALPGNYSIVVSSVGSSTTTLSNSGLTAVTDPTKGNISSSSSFTLTVDGKTTTITPSGTSLEDLATAVNASAAGLQATIVNVGGSSTPDYRLALTSTQLGADTIQLNDGSQNLLTTLSTGAAAQYTLNGGTSTVTSNSSQVTIAPGLTVNLLKANPSETVNINVTTDFTGLQTSLSNLATAYNSAVDALTQQRGQSGGALAGQSIIFSLSDVLNQVTQYTNGSGSVTSLNDLGLSLDQSGHLSFDSSTFNGQNTAAIQQFLGSATSGFLQAATNAVTSTTDSTSGIIEGESNALQDQITNENSQIVSEQSRITDLQNNLQQQLSAADATIANLQAQKTYYANLFAAEYLQNSPTSGL
jgi:flagellar hook-associated protein 2